jgi:hypothetical protein
MSIVIVEDSVDITHEIKIPLLATYPKEKIKL